jgi:processive 1,2-diacylglycerol beta-glucosyltransferase
MEELMAAADVIVTKPGGLSTSESLVMDLVPIFISPIPGQEMENIKALQSFGIGFYPPDAASIKDLIIELKEHPEKLREMKEKIARIRKPDAVKDIANVIP